MTVDLNQLALPDPPRKKHAGGRPTLYKPEFVEQAYRLCLLAATDERIADFFHITPHTLYQWQRRFPEFAQAFARGKLDADSHIAKSLYHRALGYSHPAVKIFMPAGAEEPVYAPYTEHFPPDTNAASLWLRNRQPELWKERTVVEHDISDRVADRLEAARLRMLGELPKVIEHDEMGAGMGSDVDTPRKPQER